MEKFLFCVKCKSLLTKTKLIAEDMLVAQKFLASRLEFTQLKSKDVALLFNQ